MGYELTRFIDKVDEEFHCAICLGVLQNPLQTICEHAFCKDCITKTLAIKNSCPIDRRPIRSNDLKLPPRFFLNLLNKLDMKCDFRSKGCQKVVKLENLQQHLNSCQYDPNNSEIVCDKGCNLKMTRREYEYNNCTHHLLNRVSSLEEQIRKLNMKTNARVSVNASNDNTLPMWRTCYNMFFTVDQSNYILKGHRAGGDGLPTVQSNYSLTPENSSFKVKLDVGTYSFIGLTRKKYKENRWDNIYQADESIFMLFHSGGGEVHLCHNSKVEKISIESSIDSIFECGITFPYDFDSNRDNNVEVYYSSNNVTLVRKVIVMPPDGLYPTVHLLSGFSAKYFTN